jgi:hypothetical protein
VNTACRDAERVGNLIDRIEFHRRYFHEFLICIAKTTTRL